MVIFEFIINSCYFYGGLMDDKEKNKKYDFSCVGKTF